MNLRKREDLAIILLPAQKYKLTNMTTYKANQDMSYLKHEYLYDPHARRRLVGWRPLKSDWFFSDLLIKDGIPRTMLIYPPASGADVIKPLDRLTDLLEPEALTPQIHRSYFVSNLYKNRMRKSRIGGKDFRMVALAIVIGVIILVLLYSSGYLGG